MTKKYKCRLSATSLLVTVKGKVVRLEFEPDVVSQYGLRGCSYTTANKELQSAIERSARFNSRQKDEVWTDDVEPVKEQEVNLTELQAEEVHVAEKKVVRRGKAKKEA